MKKAILALVLALAVVALAGCSTGIESDERIAEQSADKSRIFMCVSWENDGEVLVDKATRVMYWKSFGSYNYGILTLLVNPDGTPRLWEE